MVANDAGRDVPRAAVTPSLVVAALMAVSIVIPLEIINICHQDGQTGEILSLALPQTAKVGQIILLIVDAGQGIDVRIPFQLSLFFVESGQLLILERLEK